MANCETDDHIYRAMAPGCIFCGHDPSKSLGGMLGSVIAGYRDGDNQRTAKAMVGIVDLCERPQWQPIETAPKDGSIIIVAAPAVGAARWSHFREPAGYWEWFSGGRCRPTHWMPLPSPPEPGAGP
jgi:hypothetical protein